MSNQFKPILNRTAQLAGVDVTEIPDAFFRTVRDLCDARLNWSWNAADFPETVEFVEMAFNANVATLPSGYSNVISLHKVDPAAAPSREEAFVRAGDTVICRSAGDDTLWAKLKLEAPTLAGEVYAADATYSTGDQVYKNGSFWNLQGTHSSAPPSAEWEEVVIPKRFASYCAVGTWSDVLRSRDMHDQAVAAEAQAEGALALEIDRLYNQEGQLPSTRILTR